MTKVQQASAAACSSPAHPAPAINRRTIVMRSSTAALAAAVPATIAVPSIASASGDPDPIFAMIEDAHRKRDEYNAAAETVSEVKERRLWRAFMDSENKLNGTRPISIDGLYAKLEYMKWYARYDAVQYATKEFTLELLDHLLPADLTCGEGGSMNGRAKQCEFAASGDDDDPIFAAIEEHRAARFRWEQTIKSVDDGDPKLRAKELRAYKALANRIPQTVAGAAALVCYVAECHARGDEMLLSYHGDGCFREVFLKNVAAVLRPLVQAARGRAAR